MTWRTLRITVLLLVLVSVAVGTWVARIRSTDWDRPLWVAVYPINADGSDAADSHLEWLSDESLAEIEQFMAREAANHELPLQEPVDLRLYDRVETLPPAMAPDANALSRALWSLRLRYWAWRTESASSGPPPDVSMFVLYHDPDLASALPHSLGLQKGLIGVVHAFADRRMHGSNGIVIAHELLHTLGATDKYELETGQPMFRDGYADPEQEPLYPQSRAEVMAGRRMVSETEWEMPESLREVVIGDLTASEINW
jgi:hypothetical protein